MTRVDEIAVGEVRLASQRDRVRVVGEARSDVAIEGDVSATRDGPRLTLEAHGRTTVHVPRDTSVVIGTVSAAVEVAGEVAACAVTSESGRIEVEHVGSLDVRADSSRIEVARVDGACRVRSRSGRVTVHHCGTTDVSTRNGRITLTGVGGPVRAHCVSGRITVELDGAHDVDASTVSGRITVRHPADVRVARAGEPPTEGAPSCIVTARSVSGRVVVGPR